MQPVKTGRRALCSTFGPRITSNRGYIHVVPVDGDFPAGYNDVSMI
jgi:hypothetical protein